MTSSNTSHSVTWAITLSTLGVVLFCCLTLLGVQYWNTSTALERQFSEEARLAARQLGVYYLRKMSEVERQLDAVAEDSSIRVTLQLGVEYQLRERLTAFSAMVPHAQVFIRSNETGRIYGPSTTPPPAELAEIMRTPEQLTGKVILGSDSRLFVAQARDIESRESSAGSVVGVYYVEDGRDTTTLGHAIVIRLLGAFRDIDTGRPVNLEYLDEAPGAGPVRCLLNGEEGLITPTGFRDILSFSSIEPLRDAQRSSMMTAALLLLATVTACCILSAVIGRRLTVSLRSLSEVARHISLGESRVPLLEERSSLTEVNDVVQAMESMLVNLRKAEELGRYRTLFEEVIDAVFIFDLEGRIVECNTQALLQMGCDRQQMLRLSIMDLTGPENRQRIWRLLEDVYTAQHNGEVKSRKIEVRLQPVEGNPFHAEVHARKLRYMGQDAVLSVVRDVSVRIAAETALRKAKQDAEDANRAKSGFLASMSHEIRTPMHSVLGLVDMLESTSLDEEQRRYLEMLRGSGVLLLNLIDDILDFSKIEAGHLELEHISFCPEALLERAFSTVSAQAAQKGLELILYIEPDVPHRVVGDPTKLLQILLNLLSNALKFTSLGHVITTLSVAEHTDEGVTLALAVKDTGIGIPEAKQQAIFDVFTQADSSTARQFGGTGLGLAITRRLAEHLGGSVTLESRSGQGATFTVLLPMSLPESDAAGEGPAGWGMPLTGMHFLVLDDNNVTLHYLDRTLTSLGGTVRQVFSVQEALHAMGAPVSSVARGSRHDVRFDCIIMGSDLPELDGVSAHRQLVRHAGGVMPPAVLYRDLTHAAQGSKTLPPTGLPVLTKPATPGQLVAAIESAISGTQASQQGLNVDKATDATQGEVRGRVLVAEDSSANRMLMEFFLKGMPVQIDFAVNGNEAVALLDEHTYDIVFMDIQMPGMDGYAATQIIRARERETGRKAVPIIALTANAYAEDRERCLAAGCTDYLPKPAKKRHVLDLLRTYTA